MAQRETAMNFLGLQPVVGLPLQFVKRRWLIGCTKASKGHLESRHSGPSRDMALERSTYSLPKHYLKEKIIMLPDRQQMYNHSKANKKYVELKCFLVTGFITQDLILKQQNVKQLVVLMILIN